MMKFLLASRSNRRTRHLPMAIPAQVVLLEQREMLDGVTGIGSGTGTSSGSGGTSSPPPPTGSSSGSGNGSSAGSGQSSISAVDLSITLPLGENVVRVDVLAAIKSANPGINNVGAVTYLTNGKRGLVSEIGGQPGVLVYELYGFVDERLYNVFKTEFDAEINAWESWNAARIGAHYSQQVEALNKVASYLGQQNQAESFWGHVSGLTGVVSAASGPYGAAATVVSALAAIAALHVNDVAPNFDARWGEVIARLAEMQVADLLANAVRAQAFRTALELGLPNTEVLPPDHFSYALLPADGGVSTRGTVTVDLCNRIDYWSKLRVLQSNFEPLKNTVKQRYGKVPQVWTVYGALLLDYAASRGWSLQINDYKTEVTPGFDTNSEPTVRTYYAPHWVNTALFDIPFTFGADDIADELNSKRYLLPGFDPYLHLPGEDVQ